MDLNRLNGPGGQARQRYYESRREVYTSNSERVRDAREALTRLSEVRAQRLEAAREAQQNARERAVQNGASARSDEVQISDRGRILAGHHEAAASPDEPRAERVAGLKARFEAGELNTPETIERAASRLLGDSE